MAKPTIRKAVKSRRKRLGNIMDQISAGRRKPAKKKKAKAKY